MDDAERKARDSSSMNPDCTAAGDHAEPGGGKEAAVRRSKHECRVKEHIFWLLDAGADHGVVLQMVRHKGKVSAKRRKNCWTNA